MRVRIAPCHPCAMPPSLLRLPPPPPSPQLFPSRCAGRRAATVMRDRAKNRKPTQRGRYLSTEAIQAVQALKRAGRTDNGFDDPVRKVIESRVRRLVKFDMLAVLRELIAQGHPLLGLQVFEEVRKEHWYKPQLSLYVDMITVLASNGLPEKVQQVCSCLKMECLEPDTEGFNMLLRTLMEFGFVQTAMDCFRLMKLWESEPDESTYRILINGLDSKGELDLSADVRLEAERDLGEPLVFSEEEEERVFSSSS